MIEVVALTYYNAPPVAPPPSTTLFSNVVPLMIEFIALAYIAPSVAPPPLSVLFLNILIEFAALIYSECSPFCTTSPYCVVKKSGSFDN